MAGCRSLSGDLGVLYHCLSTMGTISYLKAAQKGSIKWKSAPPMFFFIPFFNVFTKQYNATLSSVLFNVPFKITIAKNLSRYVKYFGHQLNLCSLTCKIRKISWTDQMCLKAAWNGQQVLKVAWAGQKVIKAEVENSARIYLPLRVDSRQ